MTLKHPKSLTAALVSALFLISAFSGTVSAQTEAEFKDAFIKGLTLFEQGRHAEAVPHLEIMVKGMPDQANLRMMYGIALLTKSKQIDNVAEAKRLSAEALVQLQEAKKLGINEPQLDALIELLGGTVSSPAAAQTPLTEVQKIMEQAEKRFAQSKYDEAIVLYQKALSLEPKLYEAALFSGDAYVAKQDWENAEKNYQKAIAIDPHRETAYRYSATPLMKQKKYDQARDRYIDAVIAEPYNEMSFRGISQWAGVTNAKLGHPKIEFPTVPDAGVTSAPKPAKELAVADLAWNGYITTRSDWRREKFAQSFPSEKDYRHSLKEEAEAIRNALSIASKNKVGDADLQMLQKLENEGLLESYILIARPDEGIAQDYEAYRKDNRPKLLKYILTRMIQKS